MLRIRFLRIVVRGSYILIRGEGKKKEGGIEKGGGGRGGEKSRKEFLMLVFGFKFLLDWNKMRKVKIV